MPVPASLNELTSQPYLNQAKWYLNGFWAEGAKEEAEKIWAVTHKFIELDPLKEKGNELDEFNAHKLLESQGQTLTVIELRNALKAIDMDKNGKFALLEYLLHSYKKTVEACLKSPQGSSTHQDEIDKAAAKLQAVQDALAQVQQQVEAQTKALAAQKAAEEKASSDLSASSGAASKAKEDEATAKAAEAKAKSQLDAQQKAESQVKATEAELNAAIADIKAQEDAYQAQVKALDEKANQEGLSTIQRSKAAAELGQLKNQDNSALSKAKLAQQSVLKKVTKDREAAEGATGEATESHKAAEEAAKKAEASRKAAEESQAASSGSAASAKAKREELEAQTKRVEQAQRDIEARAAEAHQTLEELKKIEAVAHGTVWWMEREIEEVQRRAPKKNIAVPGEIAEKCT